jgi:putative two-component system response regulator
MKSRILFVDDEPAILRVFGRILRDQAKMWDMHFALSVDEALEKIVGTKFDAVVSDISMPGKDGFALLSALSASDRTRDIPVIILTGNTENDLKRRALDQGATDLLNKPVDPEDLRARIRSVLRLKSYQDLLKNQNAFLEEKVRERTAELESSRLDIIGRLAKAGEYRDEDTGNHVVRVGFCCRAIAEALAMDDGFIDLISVTSPLHDIGKIGIPDHILLKPGKLTPEERRTMERHCEIGAGILQKEPKGFRLYAQLLGGDLIDAYPKSENPFLKMASSIAMGHHERWDGKGYPRGLRGEEIPLEARIAAVTDVYDALGSKRPYKPAYPEEQVRAIMGGEVGRHFDPYVFAAFQKATDEIRSIRSQFPDDGAREAAAGSA